MHKRGSVSKTSHPDPDQLGGLTEPQEVTCAASRCEGGGEEASRCVFPSSEKDMVSEFGNLVEHEWSERKRGETEEDRES